MLLKHLIEDTDVVKVKQEILKSINNIDPATNDPDLKQKNADLLDKIYTILNKGNVVDRIGATLPSILKGEYSQSEIMNIAGAITDAPLTYNQKIQFSDNLAKDKVINAEILLSPGSYTIDQLCYNNQLNKAVFDHLKSYGVGKQMKGPAEHALAILSKDISIQGKGDVNVKGTDVEIKAAIGSKGNGGRFGETGEVPPYETILKLLHSYEWLKDPLDAQRAKSKNGAVNLKAFTALLNAIPNVDPAQRKDLATKLGDLFFGGQSSIFVNELAKPNADPNTVNRAYVKSQFNWYKSSNMGGSWEVLVGIIFATNSVGVLRNADDLDKMNTTGGTIYILYGKPMEALFQFNPKI